jgi:prophage regulatory protein
MSAYKLMSMNQVLSAIPLSRSTIYRRIKAGTFPRQISLGASRIAFIESEVRAWVDERAARSAVNGGATNA